MTLLVYANIFYDLIIIDINCSKQLKLVLDGYNSYDYIHYWYLTWDKLTLYKNFAQFEFNYIE